MPESKSNAMARRFFIEGMDCAEEISALLTEVGPLVGDRELLDFNVFSRTMTVAALPPNVTSDQVLAAIERAGMRGREFTDDGTEQTPESSFWDRQGRLILTATSAIAIVLAQLWQWMQSPVETAGIENAPPLPSKVLFGVAIAAGLCRVATFATR